MKEESKKKSPEMKTVSERIIDLVLSDCSSILNKEEVETRLEFLLFLLTDNQKKSTLQKIQRCKLFIEKFDKGFDESRIRSIMKNKFGVSRQFLNEICEPCKSYIKARKK